MFHSPADCRQLRERRRGSRERDAKSLAELNRGESIERVERSRHGKKETYTGIFKTYTALVAGNIFKRARAESNRFWNFCRKKLYGFRDVRICDEGFIFFRRIHKGHNNCAFRGDVFFKRAVTLYMLALYVRHDKSVQI